jgi:hypothetical protein
LVVLSISLRIATKGLLRRDCFVDRKITAPAPFANAFLGKRGKVGPKSRFEKISQKGICKSRWFGYKRRTPDEPGIG